MKKIKGSLCCVFPILIILFSCSTPVPVDDLEISSDGTYYKNGEEFSGIATSKGNDNPFTFITSIATGNIHNSITMKIEKGKVKSTEYFLDNRKMSEVVSWEEHSSEFSRNTVFVPYKYIPFNLSIYECEFKDGLKHGKEVFKKLNYFGIPTDASQIFNYKNGKKHGEHLEFHYGSDNLAMKCNYENDTLTGIKEYWKSDGRLISSENYNNNLLNGLRKEYYNDGKRVKIEQIYRDNILEKKILYSYNGKVLEKTENGISEKPVLDGLIVTHNDNGVRAHTTYKNGLKDGLEKIQYRNGDLWKEINYSNGLKNGSFKKWYRGGQLAFEVNFENDIKQGIETTYHENGNILQKSKYINGSTGLGTIEKFYDNGDKWKRQEYTYNDKSEFIETYSSWYNNGQKAENYKKVNHKKDGLYEKWYENGNKRLEVEYKNGLMHGRYLNWEENGNLYKNTSYYKGKE